MRQGRRAANRGYGREGLRSARQMALASESMQEWGLPDRHLKGTNVRWQRLQVCGYRMADLGRATGVIPVRQVPEVKLLQRSTDPECTEAGHASQEQRYTTWSRRQLLDFLRCRGFVGQHGHPGGQWPTGGKLFLKKGLGLLWGLRKFFQLDQAIRHLIVGGSGIPERSRQVLPRQRNICTGRDSRRENHDPNCEQTGTPVDDQAHTHGDSFTPTVQVCRCQARCQAKKHLLRKILG